LRDLFLKGTGIDTIWDESLLLVLFAMMMFVIAVKRFRKKVA
jgi:energy-converting hydrogenase Eha subunit F